MFKLLKYLKKSAGMICVIVLLLFLQAYCDLSLPDYTSKIVNVGIQQNGIEDAVMDSVRTDTMDKLFLFMDEESQSLIKENYTLEDDIYTLKKIDKDTRSKLNEAFGQSMMMVSGFTSDSAESKAMLAQMKLPEGADPFQVFAQMPKEQLTQIMDGMGEKLAQMPESIITQSSISFVKAEYEAQKVDIDGMQTNYILMSGLRMLAFALIIMAASILVTFLSCKIAAVLSRDLRQNVFEKVISFSNAEFDKFSTASLITRSTNDIQQVQMLMTMVFRIVLYAPIIGIGGVIRAVGKNSSMAWIIAVAVGAILVVVLILFTVAMPKFKVLQKLIDRLNLVSREILQGVSVIRAFSTEKHEEKRFETANRDLMKTNLFVNRCMTFMMPLMMFIMNGITVLIVWKGASGIDAGNMQVGDLMAFIQYTMMIIMSFLMLTMMSIMLPRASVSATRINEILETEVILHDPKDPKHTDGTKKGIVEFKDVSFAYPEAEEEVLSNLNFTAKPGETTAVIGSTGCGKSTLVNLIPRFFDVTKGQILVDGVDVREISQHELHEKIGYVPQKGVLFSGTIDSNLRYGKEDATEEQIKKAAEIAQATDFIEEKEEQYDSPIAQGGTNVSGGQKQRLSIARAIAKEPEIYIFDDSFSALDYQTDVALRGALKKETKDATSIIVAQRISTILHAEQIIVLDEGKVAGIGTHQELLKNCDVYYQIASSQLSKEELGDE